MCISKRQKSDIIIIIIIININIIRQPEPVSWFETISLIRTCSNSEINFSSWIFILRKINGLVSTTFTLEQNSGFKLERNKDLTFIVIIIDIDWYEKNYRDNFFGHIAQPYLIVT